jgi:hypothetical protein
MSVFARFVRDARASIVVIALLTVIPVLAAVGAAIDCSRVIRVRSELANALAAGVLAVGDQTKISDARALAIVRRCLGEHRPETGVTWAVDAVIRNADGSLTFKASGKVQTTVARILGVDEASISVDSEAIRSLVNAGGDVERLPPGRQAQAATDGAAHGANL